MATSFLFGAWELLILFALGLFSMPLPLGIPPQPEDPMLLRVASKESVFFVEWFGVSKPNPQSRNHTELLAAEPEVREFTEKLVDAIRRSIVAEARGDGPLAEQMVELGLAAVAAPGSVFLTLSANPQPMPSFGITVKLGDRAERFRASLQAIEELIAGEFGVDAKVEQIDGVSFRVIAADDMRPAVAWTLESGYAAFAIGDEARRSIAAGLNGGRGLADNPRYAAFSGRARVARPCMRSFADYVGLQQTIASMAPPEFAAVQKILGIDQLQAAVGESGLEGDGFVSRSHFATSGWNGLLDLVSDEPLKPEDLAHVPGDATMAVVAKADPGEMLSKIVAMVAQIQPGADAEFEQLLAPFAQMTGLDLRKDLLAHLGDTVSVWNSPRQGGLLFTGLTAAIELDDAAAFGDSFAQAMGTLLEMAPKKQRSSSGRLRRTAYLEQMKVGDTTVYWLNFVGEEFPFAPAWCASESHLLVSMFPQQIRSTLTRAPTPRDSLAARVGPDLDGVAYSQVDGAAAFRLAYPALQLLGQFLLGEAQREGFDLTIAALPTAESIAPHLGIERSVLRRVDGGLEAYRVGRIPTPEPSGALSMQMILLTSLFLGTTAVAPVIRAGK